MVAFWQRWLTLWCGAVALFGLVLAGAALPATEAPARLVLLLLQAPRPLVFDPTLRFAMAVCGAVTLGWAAATWGVMRVAWRMPPGAARPLWDALTAGVLIWFVVDSLLSVATGFAWNLVPNAALLAGYLLPLRRSGLLGRAPGP